MPYLSEVRGHARHVGSVRSALLLPSGRRDLPRVVCSSFHPALLFCRLLSPALGSSLTYRLWTDGVAARARYPARYLVIPALSVCLDVKH